MIFLPEHCWQTWRTTMGKALAYGIKSPSKFKLLYATLLFGISSRFYNPTINFCTSTLRIHKRTSKWSNSMCFIYMYTWPVAVYNAICLHRNPTSLFSTFTNQHPFSKFNLRCLLDTLLFLNATLILNVYQGVYVAMQSAICSHRNPTFLFWHQTSCLNELSLTWYAAVQDMGDQNSWWGSK